MTIAESTLIEILFIAFAAGVGISRLAALEKRFADHETRLRDIEKK